MNCPNCKIFHNTCQAKCCSFVPMDTELFNKHFNKICRPVSQLVPFDNQTIVPITEDGYCPFLQNDLSCTIYEDRPGICHKFGDESHINMTCEFQTKDGRSRTNKERRKISERQIQIAKKYLR